MHEYLTYGHRDILMIGFMQAADLQIFINPAAALASAKPG